MTIFPRQAWAAVLACALSWTVSLPADAQELASKKFGIVLMHGKEGMPDSPPLYRLTMELRNAGAKVETPEMPWSRYRRYAVPYEDAMKEIDQAVAKLKAAGAERIVIAGHSLGGNGALGYAARRDGVAGVIALAPGHSPETKFFRQKLSGEVARAKKLIAEGKGDEKNEFEDLNVKPPPPAPATARTYLSFFDPEGPAVMPKNAAALKPGTPLLWIIGEKDRLKWMDKTYAIDRAPPNPKHHFAEVPADHLGTPSESVKVVIDWLKDL